MNKEKLKFVVAYSPPLVNLLDPFTDELSVLGTTISDKRLIYNTLRGLQPQLAYMRMVTLQQCPLPSFLDVHSSLLLEELTLQQSGSSSLAPTPSAFIARGPKPLQGLADTMMPCAALMLAATSSVGAVVTAHVAAISTPCLPSSMAATQPGRGRRFRGHPCRTPGLVSIQMWPGPPQRPPLLAFPQAQNTMVKGHCPFILF